MLKITTSEKDDLSGDVLRAAPQDGLSRLPEHILLPAPIQKGETTLDILSEEGRIVEYAKPTQP